VAKALFSATQVEIAALEDVNGAVEIRRARNALQQTLLQIANPSNGAGDAVAARASGWRHANPAIFDRALGRIYGPLAPPECSEKGQRGCIRSNQFRFMSWSAPSSSRKAAVERVASQSWQNRSNWARSIQLVRLSMSRDIARDQ